MGKLLLQGIPIRTGEWACRSALSSVIDPPVSSLAVSYREALCPGLSHGISAILYE